MQLSSEQVEKVRKLAGDYGFDSQRDEGDFLPFMEMPWPSSPAQEAFHGLSGDVVREFSPYTEADDIAILVNFLVYFGNAIGRTAWFEVGATRHWTNEYAALVGPTAKARKGTADDILCALFEIVDGDWVLQKVANGLFLCA